MLHATFNKNVARDKATKLLLVTRDKTYSNNPTNIKLKKRKERQTEVKKGIECETGNDE